MVSTARTSKNPEKLLTAAFEASDLRRICSAVDAGILQFSSIIEVARAAEVDRVTLYRAFRLGKGPALDTMIKVLRVLGFQLVVQARHTIDTAKPPSTRPRAAANAEATARVFSTAFESGENGPLLKAFAETLRAQENVTEFARKTIRSREALYRVFTGPRTPRFSTTLSYLNALGLRFAVRRLPHKFCLRA